MVPALRADPAGRGRSGHWPSGPRRGDGTGEAATLAGSRVGTTGRVIGIDVSAPMLRIAASKVAKQAVSLFLMDGQTLAFRDESFDAVVCQLGLMFLPDPATALREWTRVLRGGARLAVCVWAAPEHVPLFGILMDELSRYFPDQRDVLYQPSALTEGDRSSDFSLERGSPRFVSRGRPAHIDSHRSRSIGSRSRPVGDATGSCS